MTCIVWDGKTLASDKYVWVNGIVATATKIQRVGDVLVGVSGANTLIPQIFAWAREGFTDATIPILQKNPEDHAVIMVITKDRQILMYENSCVPWINERKIWAIGSGREIAIGALAAGASAIDAIEITADYSGNCGRGYDALTFEEDLTT